MTMPNSLCDRHPLLFGFNCRLDGLIHLGVAGAATQITTESVAYLDFGWLRIFSQQMLHRHDEAGRAEAALRATPVTVSFLDGSQAAVLAHTLDGRDLLPFAARGQHSAGQHGDPINQNSTSAAGGVVAATF